jgi:hypothetical protein
MQTLDGVNKRYGRGTIKLASAGTRMADCFACRDLDRPRLIWPKVSLNPSTRATDLT